jgi:hypothetical protein
MADGEVYDDPSGDLLYILFDKDLDRDGASFRLERLDRSRSGEAIVVRRLAHDCFELAGPGNLRGRAPLRAAHEALTRWASGLPDWREPLDA